MRRNFLHKEVFLYFQVFVSLSNSVRYRFLIIFTWLNLLMYWAESIRSVTWAVKRQPPPFFYERAQNNRGQVNHHLCVGVKPAASYPTVKRWISSCSLIETPTQRTEEVKRNKAPGPLFSPVKFSFIFLFTFAGNVLLTSQFNGIFNVTATTLSFISINCKIPEKLKDSYSNSTRAVAIDY